MESTNQPNDKIKSILAKTKQNIKKGVQVGVLGTALAAGVAFTGCEMPVNVSTGNTETVIPTGPEDPYNKIINWDYVFHNFIGKEPNITELNAERKTEGYLNQGKEYLQKQFDDFQASIQDRPTLKKYFADFTYENATYYPGQNSHHRTDYGKEMDLLTNRLAYVSEYYLNKIVENLYYEKDREAFYLCYATLANEAYKEGFGENFTKEAKTKYDQERAKIKAAMEEHYDLRTINYDHDVDDRNCKQNTDHMNILLGRAANYMYSETEGEITAKDLRGIINASLCVFPLTSAHDYMQDYLHHYNCNIRTKNIDETHKTVQNTQKFDEMSV